VSNADCDNASKHIQITGALVVIEPLHVTLVDEERLLVVGQVTRTDVVLSDLFHLLVRWSLFITAHQLGDSLTLNIDTWFTLCEHLVSIVCIVVHTVYF
jgi:hypothetical protein